MCVYSAIWHIELGADGFKLVKINVKTLTFLQFFVTFICVVPLQWHVNHGKMCLLNIIDIQKN